VIFALVIIGLWGCRVVRSTMVRGADYPSSLPVSPVRLTSRSLTRWRHL